MLIIYSYQKIKNEHSHSDVHTCVCESQCTVIYSLYITNSFFFQRFDCWSFKQLIRVGVETFTPSSLSYRGGDLSDQAVGAIIL